MTARTEIAIPEETADALAQIIADARNEWQQACEVMKATLEADAAGLRADIAELRAEVAKLEAAYRADAAGRDA